MATALNLEDTLVGLVQKVVANTLLKGSLRDDQGNPVYVSPFVVPGYIPSYLTGEIETQVIPHVVVQFSADDSTFEKTSLTIELLISTLDAELDHQGYRDAVNLATKLKTALFEERILARTWRLVMPFNFRIVHVEQDSTRAIEHPVYRVVMLTTWETASPTSRFDSILSSQEPR